MGIPLATLLTVLAIGSACAQSDWKVGRATFYGTDGWSIHQGSCGFYYIFEVCTASTKLSIVNGCAEPTRANRLQDSPLGWDVAALTDVNPLYAGSCGYGSLKSALVSNSYTWMSATSSSTTSYVCQSLAVQVLF